MPSHYSKELRVNHQSVVLKCYKSLLFCGKTTVEVQLRNGFRSYEPMAPPLDGCCGCFPSRLPQPFGSPHRATPRRSLLLIDPGGLMASVMASVLAPAGRSSNGLIASGSELTLSQRGNDTNMPRVFVEYQEFPR